MFDARLDRRQVFLGAGALALLPGAVRATTIPEPWGPVYKLVNGYVGRLPGAVAAVARGTAAPTFAIAGKIAFDSATAVDFDSLFRIYSMTKPITGMAAMLLVEDGKLKLDQNVADFIPGFARPMVALDPVKSLAARPAARPITIRNLLTHTAGLSYIISAKGALLAEYVRLGLSSDRVSRFPLPGVAKLTPAPSLQAFADRIATVPLIADPGTRWSYSAGLDVLGAVIERASGMPFERFLQTRLFGPLGMVSTFFTVPKGELGRMTTNYGIVNGKPVPIDPGATTVFGDPPAFPAGGGGLVSSPRDYDRFLQMLAGGGAIGGVRVMQEATARLAMSNLLPPGADTKGTLVDGQGFGAGGRVTLNGRDRFGAGPGTYGWGGAAGTVAWIDPSRGVRASGFVQYMPPDSLPFGREFGAAVYASL